jgi:hypothetical protein
MPDQIGLAQAAARIAELEGALAAAQAATVGAQQRNATLARQLADAQAQTASTAPLAERLRATETQNSTLERQLSALQTQIVDQAPLLARVAELEKLLAPPPPNSGIVTVTYSDGRVKYAATNGDKFSTSAEASHRNMVLAVQKAAGLTEAQAETIVARKDTLVTALST